MATVPTPKRGEVWLVRFDPSAGAAIRKVRLAVVVNLDAIGGRLPLRIVVPVTDSKSDFGNLSWFVFLPAASENGLSKDSGADAFQLKSVSETRFVRKLGEVTIPYAAMSETSSNCWKFSVINEASCWEYLVDKPSRTSWMAA